MSMKARSPIYTMNFTPTSAAIQITVGETPMVLATGVTGSGKSVTIGADAEDVCAALLAQPIGEIIKLRTVFNRSAKRAFAHKALYLWTPMPETTVPTDGDNTLVPAAADVATSTAPSLVEDVDRITAIASAYA